MKYEQYITVEDFVTDDFFILWVTNPDQENEKFWKNYLETNPEKQFVVDEARRQIKSLRFKNYSPTPVEEREVWEKISLSEKSRSRKKSTKFVWIKAAAVLAALGIAIGIVLLSLGQQMQHIETSYGQTKKIVLPDKSIVYLNANSTLSYPENLTSQNINSGNNREVWLKGEAYFIVKKRNGSKFIVNTQNLSIEVLGTEFNVNNRRKKTQVVLSSGKIKINSNQVEELDNMILKPGDLLEYSETTKKINTKKVETKVYSSWKENYLQFDETSLGEIAALLEDNYGYKIKFGEKSIAENRFTGVIPTNDLDILWKVLSKSFMLEININKEEISINKKPASE